jgi:hypothetical protein
MALGRSIKEIISQVAHEHGLTAEDLTGRSPLRRVRNVRQEAYYRAYEYGRTETGTRPNLVQVARRFGRNRTTVHCGILAYCVREAVPIPSSLPIWPSKVKAAAPAIADGR